MNAKKSILSLLAVASTLALASAAFALLNGRVPTRLAVETASGTFRGKAYPRARLTELFGSRPIVGAPLELEIIYPTYSTRLGTWYTGSDGYAKATVVLSPSDIPSRGSYTLAWTYRGNGTYAVPSPYNTLTVR